MLNIHHFYSEAINTFGRLLILHKVVYNTCTTHYLKVKLKSHVKLNYCKVIYKLSPHKIVCSSIKLVVKIILLITDKIITQCTQHDPWSNFNLHAYFFIWDFLWVLRNTVCGLISHVHYGEWNILSSLLITSIPSSQINVKSLPLNFTVQVFCLSYSAKKSNLNPLIIIIFRLIKQVLKCNKVSSEKPNYDW